MSKEPMNKSRRDFLKAGSAGVIGLGAGSMLGGGLWVDRQIHAIPASEGYLLVDTKKCQGCATCMLACSLAHEGKTNMSLARIQIQQDPFDRFPYDVKMDQCRQCTYPACVVACPTQALHPDEENGVRLVSPEKCIGCQRCLMACPYETTSTTWNHVDKHMQKCDLCMNTPYWEEEGGPGGKQACISVCPTEAISFSFDIPTQAGNSGYKINLRRQDDWSKLGWTTKD